jgi:hypothetical protein
VYETSDPGEALDLHIKWFFANHELTHRRWPIGPIDSRIAGFFVYAIGPGPRWPGWSYVSSGCWRSTAQDDGHGSEFVLSTADDDPRHVELMTVNAYYHAGPASHRLDLGHTVPIGEPWTPDSQLDHLLVSLPYAYGPDLEVLAWRTGHARLLSLIPISRTERDFKAVHGLEALEQRLDQAAVDFANPARKAAI